MRRQLRLVVRIVGAAVAVAGIYIGWYWFHPLNAGEETYELKPGAGLHSLAHELTARGVLPEGRTFTLFAALMGHGRDVKAGEYRFPAGESAYRVLERVVEGRVVEYPVVFVEGWTFRQDREALRNAPKLTQTLDGLSDREVMARLGHPDEMPEGRFFPDTYRYARGQTDLEVLRRAYERMQQRLQREWDERDPGVPYRTPYDALIMASIIEKETGRAEERPLIAGVFINRLRLHMKLQTDPSVIYGLGDKFDGNLHVRDLRRDGPYNTYTRHGLPPTPIAMPGGDSLHAALHPDRTRAIYFVSRGDGTHEFSETLAEQDRAVVKYQLNGHPAAGANAGAGPSHRQR